MQLSKLFSLAFVAMSATGCGDRAGKADPESVATSPRPTLFVGGFLFVEPGRDTVVGDKIPSNEDIACQQILAGLGEHGLETYCKDNAGDQVCQWLYVSQAGEVYFHQAADGECDKQSENIPLTCAEAIRRST
jgi:hypothetical protein